MTSTNADSQSHNEGKEGKMLALKPEQYTVGWICALPTELTAAKAMLDANHAPLESHPAQDNNHYDLGNIGKHNVVITCLPAYGNVPAAITAMSMQNTFPSLRFGLSVGVGGGIPGEDNDIILGDIVVSLPEGQGGGVIQYDMGRRGVNGFERVGMLNKPPRPLLAVIPTLRSTRTLGKEISELVNQKFGDDEDADEEWTYPRFATDILFRANYKHMNKNPTCGACAVGPDSTISRDARKTTNPKIHYGNIGSENSVMKDGELRDQLAERDNIICFEMEAAGLMDKFPCLVMLGISDYPDSHKNWEWQPYSAAVAAIYAKKLLTVIRPTDVTEMRTIYEEMERLSAELAATTATSQRVEKHVLSM
jgi:nucleoside phosphorylase